MQRLRGYIGAVGRQSNRSSKGNCPRAIARFNEPQVGKSRRDVSLSPMVVEALRRRKVRQNQDRPALDARCDKFGLCFTVVDAKPARTWISCRDICVLLIKAASVPPIRFYDLRHPSATLFLAAGNRPKIVGERLGMTESESHSTSTTTTDSAGRGGDAWRGIVSLTDCILECQAAIATGRR
jgi:integrase